MPCKLRQLARANYTLYTKQRDSFVDQVVLQGPELVHIMHAGSWAGRQVVPLFRSCAGRAANHPRLAIPLSWARISSRSSNHHYEMPFQLLPLRPKHAPPSFSSLKTLVLLSASGLCSHRATQYFEVSVAEVMTYTVPARPMRLLDFLDLQAPCPVAPLSSQ